MPKAKGEASRQLEQAAAYRERWIKEVDGEAAVPVCLTPTKLVRRHNAPVVFGTDAGCSSKSEKVIVDKGQGGAGVVPYLPLPELKKRSDGATQ